LRRLAPLVVAFLGGAAGLTACGGSSTTPTTATATATAVQSARCSQRGPDPVHLAEPEQPVRPGLAYQLVPTGPTYATTCRYGSIDGRGNPGGLQRSRVVTSPQ